MEINVRQLIESMIRFTHLLGTIKTMVGCRPLSCVVRLYCGMVMKCLLLSIKFLTRAMIMVMVMVMAMAMVMAMEIQ